MGIKTSLFRPNGDITAVFLDGIHWAVIDTEDLPKVVAYTWYTKESWSCPGMWYAWANYYKDDGKRSTLGMHQAIIGRLPRSLEIDHFDHNGLNNRKSNLRVVTRKQNQENRIKARIDSETGIMNVSYRKDNNTWTVHVQSNHEKYYKQFPGTPEGFEQAKAAALELRRELFTHSQENV